MPTGKIVKNIGHGQKITGKHIFLIKYVKQTIWFIKCYLIEPSGASLE